MALLTFYCLIDKQAKKLFKVSIPADANVSKLKEAIHFEGQNLSFRDIDADDLILFKVTANTHAAATS